VTTGSVYIGAPNVDPRGDREDADRHVGTTSQDAESATRSAYCPIRRRHGYPNTAPEYPAGHCPRTPARGDIGAGDADWDR
jgi:hypothetical protein